MYRYLTQNKTEVPHLLTGWRNEAVGKTLVAMMNAGDSVKLTWQDGWLRQIKE